MSLLLCVLVLLHAATVCWRLVRVVAQRQQLGWRSVNFGPLSLTGALVFDVLGLVIAQPLVINAAGRGLWLAGLVLVTVGLLLAGLAWPLLHRPSHRRAVHATNLVVAVLLLIPFGLMVR